MKPMYKIFFTFSLLLTIGALIVTFVMWRKSGGSFLSADFRGGSLLEVSFKNGQPHQIIRERTMTEERRQEILKDLAAKYGPVTQERFDNIGPIVGKELIKKSEWAVAILLAVIIIYISFVFRTMSRVLSPWVLGIAAVLALIHDVIIPVGVFSLLGYYGHIEITAVFVAAALTILGYSVSDTVVVFDRVRENVIRYGSSAKGGSASGGKDTFPELVHKSILQTLTRSINTSMTTLLSLLAIFFFGGESIKYFALALIIGIISGTYSSIFVAAPIVVWWHRRRSS